MLNVTQKDTLSSHEILAEKPVLFWQYSFCQKVRAVEPMNQSEVTNEGKMKRGQSMKHWKSNNFSEMGSAERRVGGWVRGADLRTQAETQQTRNAASLRTNRQRWISSQAGHSQVRRRRREEEWWRCVAEAGGSEWEGGGRGGAEEPTAMRTLWLDNEEVPHCQPTPFTLHGSDPKVSTS